VLAAEIDLRVGGGYRVRFLRMLDSTEYESCGELLEIVRPELVRSGNRRMILCDSGVINSKAG
jgi:hypothetical protein